MPRGRCCASSSSTPIPRPGGRSNGKSGKPDGAVTRVLPSPVRRARVIAAIERDSCACGPPRRCKGMGIRTTGGVAVEPNGLRNPSINQTRSPPAGWRGRVAQVHLGARRNGYGAPGQTTLAQRRRHAPSRGERGRDRHAGDGRLFAQPRTRTAPRRGNPPRPLKCRRDSRVHGALSAVGPVRAAPRGRRANVG
jgi:hypothetical protein